MSVYNSGVKTMTVYTILSYTTFCHFAIKSFDLEGWAVGEAVTINALYLAYKSAGHMKQLSACDCVFCQQAIALSKRVVIAFSATPTLKFRARFAVHALLC